MRWRAAWNEAMTQLGYEDSAMARGGTNRSNSGPVAVEYMRRWRSDPGKPKAGEFIQAHLSEIAEAVAQPRV